MAALKGNLERQRQKILATLWFVHARRMHANEKRPPVPIETKTHQAKNPCCRSKLSRLRRRRSPAQRREGSVSGAAVADCLVKHMQDSSKCGIQSRLQQALIGRNVKSSRQKAPHRGGDNRSPKASKRSLAALPPCFENRSSLLSENQKNFDAYLFARNLI